MRLEFARIHYSADTRLSASSSPQPTGEPGYEATPTGEPGYEATLSPAQRLVKGRLRQTTPHADGAWLNELGWSQ